MEASRGAQTPLERQKGWMMAAPLVGFVDSRGVGAVDGLGERERMPHGRMEVLRGGHPGGQRNKFNSVNYDLLREQLRAPDGCTRLRVARSVLPPTYHPKNLNETARR